MKFWILDAERHVVPATLKEWGEWFETQSHLGQDAPRQVASNAVYGYHISTVFLGFDNNFDGPGRGAPVLWETMVFGEGPHNRDMDRCSGTWEQAEEMHRRMCDRVREALGVER